MSDRELLEAAARAAGLPVEWDDRTEQTVLVDANEWAGWWNPLIDDGEALRLAVKLRISVYHAPSGAMMAISPDGSGRYDEDNGDPLAATRRAITRAAAELGKQNGLA